MKPLFIKDLSHRITGGRKRIWSLFVCQYCNKEFEAFKEQVSGGHKKSCGCATSHLKTKHILKHGLSKTKLFNVWWQMKERCYNHKNISYKNYGGRGIIVCNDWNNDFKVFYDWCLENGYKEGLSIDRKNNDGNYDPLNCRFTDNVTQNCNRRNFNKTGYRGVEKRGNMYIASLSIKNKKFYIGSFSSAEECAKQRDIYVIKNNLKHSLNFNRSNYE